MSLAQPPAHWMAETLGNLATEFISGGTPATGEPAFWDGNVPWTTSAPIAEDDVAIGQGQRFITEAGLDGSASHLVPKGSLLVGTRVGVGKAVVNEIGIAISQDLTGVVIDSKRAMPHFLAYQFKMAEVQRYFDARRRGTTIKGISRFDLQQLELRLPPLPEQRAIARALRAVQEAKEARQRELALESERKAGLMEFLFTHGTRGEPTKMTEIGKIPESWRVISLGDLCSDGLGTIQTGPFGSQLHASDYREEGIPVVNPTHLGVNTIHEERLPRISKEDADRLSRHYLMEGDILISRRGDFSRYSYVARKHSGWLCGTGCLLVRLNNPNLDSFFLAATMSLEVVQAYLKQAAVGSIMPNLNTKILERMPALLPPIDEQHRIASLLAGCEAKINALERETPLVEELFRAMLEELMTGRLPAVPLIEQVAAT